MKKSRNFTLDELNEIYRLGDAIYSDKRYADFDELKAQTGIYKKELQRIFRARLTDNEIVTILKATPPDLNFYKKCGEIKRLSLGTINSAECLRILFRSLDA